MFNSVFQEAYSTFKVKIKWNFYKNVLPRMEFLSGDLKLNAY